MRPILVLVLTGCLALLALPGAAMAHGTPGEVAMEHMSGCPDCPDLSGAGTSEMPHDCPHLTGCAAMVLVNRHILLLPPKAAPERHDLPPSRLPKGAMTRIDLPPPRLRA